MALTIYEADRDEAAAMAVLQEVRAMRPSLQGDAGMGKFWISRAGPDAHALTTSGAGPCMIIIIRDSDGGGGLGHYGGTPRSTDILAGLAVMVQKLGTTITDVLFAAGQIGDEQEQAIYDHAIVAGATQTCPTAVVSRVMQLANGDIAGAAVYLPREGRVALFGDDADASFWGTGGEEGLETAWYS